MSEWDDILQGYDDKKNWLPVAKRAFSRTIGLNLVPVTPMPGSPLLDQDKIDGELKRINRNNKIDSLLKDIVYEHRKELTEEELKDLFGDDYKSGPTGNLFYIDYKFSATNSTSKPC